MNPSTKLRATLVLRRGVGGGMKEPEAGVTKGWTMLPDQKGGDGV